MDSTADAQLVEMARSGGQQAFAELYNRYFEPVYDFASRLTRSRDEAESIVQETFLTAMYALGGLHRGISFRTWIFTIARNTALSRVDRASRARPRTDAGEWDNAPFHLVDADRFSGAGEAAQAYAVAPLVWEAAAGLDPRQLSLLDLHLRQGLDSGEIADVLGVTKSNGHVVLNRLRKAVEAPIGASIMLRDGRRHCPELDHALDSARLRDSSPEVRTVVDQHAAQCPECGERMRRLAPLAAFGAFVAITPPAGAKAAILNGLLDQWPGPAPGGAAEIPPTAVSGPGGFFGGTSNFLKVGAGLGLAATLLAIVLIVPASPISLTRKDGPGTLLAAAGPGGDDTPAPGPPATPTATRPPTGASSVTPSPGGPARGTVEPLVGGLTPTPGAVTPAAAATPVPTSAATPAPTATDAPPAGTATPTPTQPPCNPTLGTFSGSLTVAPGGSSSFALTNLQFLCGSAAYAITASMPWLGVSPAAGTLGPGQSAAIGVTVDNSQVPAEEGSYAGFLRISGPNGQAFEIQVTTSRGGQPPLVRLITDRCSRTDSSLFVRVSATDDIGVVAVGVRYTDVNGQTGSHGLNLSGGSAANGTWEAQFNISTGAAPSAGVASYIVQATDGAGRTGSFSRTC